VGLPRPDGAGLGRREGRHAQRRVMTAVAHPSRPHPAP
jgi:hypothetical protein